MGMMKKLLYSLLIILLVASAGFAADKKVRWNLAMTWGPTLHPLSDTAEHMAEIVKDLSDGNFIIKVDASNVHKSPFGIFDMVKLGQYEMGHTASYYYKGKNIAFLPLTTMPFGMTAPEQYAWFYYGGGLELMQETYAKHGMLAFPGGNTGNQMGGWFTKEINSLDDLKGLKMRIPGFAGQIMAKLGVTVTNIPPGELYTALERGTVDAVEWTGPGMDINMGFHKIAKYYYTGWNEPGSEVEFLINEKEYNKLSEKYKKILKIAIKTAAYDMYIQSYEMNAEAWQQMKEKYPDIKVKVFPEEVLKEMKTAYDNLVASYEKESPMFKKIMKSKRVYLDKVRDWTHISDYLYLKSTSENNLK